MLTQPSLKPFVEESLSLPEVQSFDCGDEPWAITINEWIKSGDAVTNMRKRGTKIWLYYVNYALVGYGSLGVTNWPILFPEEPKKPVLILPNLGVQKQEKRKGYGTFICKHLIGEADPVSRTSCKRETHRSTSGALGRPKKRRRKVSIQVCRI